MEALLPAMMTSTFSAASSLAKSGSRSSRPWANLCSYAMLAPLTYPSSLDDAPRRPRCSETRGRPATPRAYRCDTVFRFAAPRRRAARRRTSHRTPRTPDDLPQPCALATPSKHRGAYSTRSDACGDRLASRRLFQQVATARCDRSERLAAYGPQRFIPQRGAQRFHPINAFGSATCSPLSRSGVSLSGRLVPTRSN